MKRWLLLSVVALTMPCAAQGQGTGRISGTVTAEGNVPIAAATVSVVGTSRSATTDSAGGYTITEVPTGVRLLQARRVGYSQSEQSVNVAAGATMTVDFRIIVAITQLKGVTIVGYGTEERARVTGAIGEVGEQQLKEIATNDPIKAIQGRIPGVEVVAGSNLPGSGMNIRIRGVRSLTASNNPLIVVDGIPLSGNVSDFNPSNIANIEVLKDASATAIYGSRGANGVVLITTKTGSSGGGMVTQYTFDSYAGTSTPLHLVNMMNMAQYTNYLRAGAAYAGVDTSITKILNPQQYAAYQTGASTDWQRAILQSGIQKSYQLGLTGATNNTHFSVSSNYFDQRGLAPGEGYNRIVGTASVDHTSGRLRLGVTATYSHASTDVGYGDGLWGVTLAQTPFGTPYDSNHVLVQRPDGDPLRINPFADVQNFIRQQTSDHIFASAFAQYQIADGLTWRANFGPDITSFSDGTFAGSFTNQQQLGTTLGSVNNRNTFAYTFDNLIQYNKDFGRDHHLEFTGLYSIQRNRNTYQGVSATALPYDSQLWYNLSTGVIQADSSNLTVSSLESFMGRVNYTFKGKYTITATLRDDGSSVLAPGNKWSTFPSFGAAWQLGDEPFMRKIHWLDALKVRASFGTTGNAAIGAYSTEGSLNATKYNFGTTTAGGFGSGSIPNPGLQWEKTDQYDAGLEFAVLNNRVTGTFDYYRQNTYNLLTSRSLPATSGYTSVLQNVGNTENDGVEISVSTVNVQHWHGIRWESTLNFAHDHNAITKLASGLQADIGNGWFVGQPININSDGQRRVFYDYVFNGIWQTADSTLAKAYGQKPGQIRLKDLNGDGKIDANNDRAIIGNTYPRWTASVYNRVSWNRFDFAMLASAKIGYTIFDDFNNSVNQLQGRYGNIVTNYWTPTNPSNTEPAPGFNGNPVAYSSTRAYIDGSHWRIRNITLGYTMPQTFTHRYGFNNTRLYLTAQDPIVFTHYQGYDPENGTAGGAPAFRTIIFGANFGW